MRYIFGGISVLAILLSFGFTPVYADSFTVSFDKEQYLIGDSVLLSGEIFDFTMPSIAMSIYDPQGKIISANNLEITEQVFAKTISLDSTLYEKTGTYKIKFDYGKISENHFFTIQNTNPEPESIVEAYVEPEILLLYTEKKQYTDKDTVEITGRVSSLDSPVVLIGIYDPFGMPAGFYFGQINSDLEFFTSFLVKDGVNFRTDGIYSVKAHYAETETVSFFEYNKVLPITLVKVDEIIENTDEMIKSVEKIVDGIVESETIPSHVEEKTSNETISEPILISSDKEIIDEEINNDNSLDETLIIDDSQNPELTSKDDSIIQIIVQNDKQESQSLENKKINDTKNDSEELLPTIEIKKQTNLTVEDIQLGLLLNQINLECDSSTFTDMISYYDGMGPALYRLCKFDSSLNFFNESLLENPTNVEVLVNQGSTLRQLGHFSKSLDSYELAIDIDPNFIPAKNNKANILASTGNFDDAILLYNEILDENPDSVTVKKNLEIVLSKISEFQKEDDIVLESVNKITNLDLPVIEKTNTVSFEKEKPTNFIEEISSVFSSIGTLFGFLN